MSCSTIGCIAYARASWKILVFYAAMVTRFGEIHADLPSGKLLNSILSLPEKQAAPKRVQIHLGFKQAFNDAYGNLRKELRELLTTAGAASFRFETIMTGSFVVRAAWVAVICMALSTIGVAALSVRHRLLLLCVGLAQFAIAPMSLVVCVVRLGTNASDCVLHYICNGIASAVVSSLGGAGLLTFTMNGRFALGFFIVDFLLNLIVYLRASEPFGAARLLKHIAYGSFNTKTYFLVVLGILVGYDVSLPCVVLTGLLTRSVYSSPLYYKILDTLGVPCFPILFYCEHRINHCPIIYAHAHKLHHYLHDTTAFDAHIYGSGMNEEFGWIVAETVPCLFFPGVLFPYFMNPMTLLFSWTNKGGHTRTSDAGAKRFGDYDEDNWHADHHTLHSRNFGSAHGVFLDFYFDTAGHATHGAWGKRYTFEPGPMEGSAILCVADLPSGESNRTAFM